MKNVLESSTFLLPGNYFRLRVYEIEFSHFWQFRPNVLHHCKLFVFG